MLGWLFGANKRQRRGAAAAGTLDADAMVAEFEALRGFETRAAALPGWALMLRSPYGDHPPARSWFGGGPCVPPDVAWPRGSDGRPLHFLAQIDLGQLAADPRSGARGPGLPETGAIVVFVGRDYACRIVSEADMASARPAVPPADIGSLSDLGFWLDAPDFPCWALDPVAFLDTGTDRPEFALDPFDRPQDWIPTCGLASLEADLVIEALERELRRAEDMERLADQRAASSRPMSEVQRSQRALFELVQAEAPGVIAQVRAFQVRAVARPATEAVDVLALDKIFALRRGVAEQMGPYRLRTLLEGSPAALWDRLRLDYPALRSASGHTELPTAYRPFAERQVTRWRGHRLMGLEPPPPNNFDDLRGKDCLIAISADDLLGTRTEHEHGLSIWCPREDMAAGRFDTGVLLRHLNG